jgi:formate hydrogenlyase subunit 3/multisubunit Na+/H+ antiporter MnhD subunit
VSRDARFYITTAYPFLVVAVFFLANAEDDTDLSWVVGIGWAFIATVMLVYGFQALDTPDDATSSTGEPQTAPAPTKLPPRTTARRKSANTKR